MKKRTLLISYILLVISMLILNGCGNTDETALTNTDSNSSSYVEAYSDNDFNTTDWTDETHSKKVDPNYDEVFVDTEVKRLDFVVTADRWQSMLDNMSDLYGEFGAATSVPVGPPTGGLDTSTTTLVDTDEDPIFVPADIYYDGLQWYRAGIRFKGNSSLQTAWESGILKLSFKLDFDEFEDNYLDEDGEEKIKNQRFYGFKKFSLKNNYDDSSFLREKVAADVFKDAGLVVSHTAFYALYIDHGDGAEYFGLYTLVEEVDGSVLDTQFSSDDGNLYKPEDGSADFVEYTFNQEDFTKKTNEDDEDWSDIEALFSALHDTTRLSDPATWRANLESIFDVDVFLKYLAVNGIIQNWDTYGKMTHNYYLYNNPDNNKLTWIPWDNNEALEEGKLGGSLKLDFSNLDPDSWPLIEKIYADSTYRAQYDIYLQDVIEDAFKTDTMLAKYSTYSDLIEDYTTTERSGFSFINSGYEFYRAIDDLKTHASDRDTAVDNYLQ